MTALPAMPAGGDSPAGSPEWWVRRLENELDSRMRLIQIYEDYYEGRHKLNFATAKFREAFAGQIAAVSDNWMPLVIRASVERLRVQGFRLGEPGDLRGDDDAWRIWQENQLDADSGLAFTEAAKIGEAALMVWQAPQDRPGVFGRLFQRRGGPQAEITVEHPAQIVVARKPGNRRKRAAALKKWREDDGRVCATLYLPDWVYRYERDAAGGKWRARENAVFATRNPLGVVPVVPVVNDPHMLPCFPPRAMLDSPHYAPPVAIGLGWSDLAPVISTQDRINKYLCDAMVAAEFHGYPQRYATGLEVPVDDEGNPVEPVVAASRMLITADPDVKFGQFALGDIGQLLQGATQATESLAARTRTPPHYLLGQIVNVSGDTLKAAETGLVSKVKDKQRSYGESIEEAMRLAFAIEGDKAKAGAAMAEVDWVPPESRSESEHVDSLVKKLSIGVPVQQLWSDAGYSPQQIAQFRAMLQEQALDQGIFDVQGLPPEPPPAGLAGRQPEGLGGADAGEA